MAAVNVRRTLAVALALAALSVAAPATAQQTPLAQDTATLAAVDRAMEDYRLDAHIPGMVWGIVKDGALVHVKGAGVQDLEARRPVTPDSLFRIASMTKAFTALSILKLRDEGKLSLDAPAETYVPELRGLDLSHRRLPEDSRARAARRTPPASSPTTRGATARRRCPKTSSPRLLAQGVPFTRPPAMQMEYSNLGYALLGRIVANVSQGALQGLRARAPCSTPLGMTATGYDVAAAPAARRALGYRWEDNAWTLEPTMAHGAFGAMGGLQTSATDYAKWVAFLLQAWPPRDGADAGPVRRSSVRELAQGANFRVGAGAARGQRRRRLPRGRDLRAWASTPPPTASSGSRSAMAAAIPATARTCSCCPTTASASSRWPIAPTPVRAAPVWDAAVALLRAGHLAARPLPASPALVTAYARRRPRSSSGVGDRGRRRAGHEPADGPRRQALGAEIAALKAQVGRCETSAPIAPSGALAGDFTWRCEHGRVRGSVLLAPTPAPRIQALTLTRATP